ncbi:MAG TPA: aryl-sulfate sulfotransferase [Bryobacteraceae bacterium]|nr:aryl-sulfate sulfotransferase [Bryobacteraceae bacterium]
MRNRIVRIAATAVHHGIALILFTTLCPAMSVQLRRHGQAELTAGQPMDIRAEVSDASGRDLRFRFRVRTAGSPQFRLVRDFSPEPSLRYVPMAGDGEYEIETSVLDRASGVLETVMESYAVAPLAGVGEPAVAPTANALVFVYGAPACAAGAELRISVFPAAGNAAAFELPPARCEGSAIHAYIAGLRPETSYRVGSAVFRDGNQQLSHAPVDFRTGALPIQVAPVPSDALNGASGLLFQNRLFQPSVAVDTTGTVVWYYDRVMPYLVRPHGGGYWFALNAMPNVPLSAQTLELIDLAGNVVVETNAERLSDQLAARGMRAITSLHHEARRLPDGRIAVLAGVELVARSRSGDGDTGVMGDMVLVLSEDLEIVWAWDAFDHMDAQRETIPDERCGEGGGGGCPASYLPGQTVDWTHANSLALTSDGNFLISFRHQDWVVKVEYANGSGSGQLLWRFGRDGDFQLESGKNDDWFSHQHDANFVEIGGRTLLLIFDNANTRNFRNAGATSRGQLYELDETARTAKLVMNADLGVYSFALGSAQLLPNGNFWFEAGIKPDFGSDGVEVSPTGEVVRRVSTRTAIYRSEWLPSIYAR